MSRADAVGTLGSSIKHETACGIGLRTRTCIRITGERARITGDTPPKLSVYGLITACQTFMGDSYMMHVHPLAVMQAVVMVGDSLVDSVYCIRI